MFVLSCAEMGQTNCNYASHGETKEAVVEDLINHAKTAHGIDTDDAGKEKMMGMVKEQM